MKRSPLVVIFVTVLIDLIGFGIVIPVLPFYAEHPSFNATPRDIGLLFASYSVMQLIFSPILGRLSDRYGRRPVLFLSLIGTGIGFLILGFATTLWMLFAGRILDGITGGNISTAQAYIADVTKPEDRARGMGLIGAAFGLGFVFGPAIGGILSRWGVGVPFLFAAALAFANAALLYFTLPETITPDHPARKSAASARWRGLAGSLKRPRFALILVIFFLFIVSFSMMTATYALYTMYRFDYTAQHNGYLFALVGIIAVLVQGVLIGKLSKRFGEAPLIITGALLFALALFATPAIGPTSGGLVALLLLTATFAVGNSLATPALNSLASKSAREDEQGGILGVTQSVAGLARAIGPAVAAFLIYSATAPRRMDDHSVLVTFWTAAGIMVGAFLLSWYFAKTYASDMSHQKIAAAGS